ncbi:MAG: hypothetical protein FWF92_04305 [Oscillospiraceae bacterium]|nr:hypothetical protein [Oscillospiraceae bacterium]
MSYFRKTKNFRIIIILFILFIFTDISGCAKNNDIPDKSNEALQVIAFVSNETDPLTDIITGTLSYSQAENTDNTEIIFSTETTEIITITESSKIIEITTDSEDRENTENIDEDIDKIAELYVITPSGKKYHYSTCRTVKNIKEYLTKEKAEQMGYEPCKICNPK